MPEDQLKCERRDTPAADSAPIDANVTATYGENQRTPNDSRGLDQSSEWNEAGGADTVANLARPTTLGRYQVRGVLGSGGFGVVFEGWDPQLERRVAIKVPRPGLLDSPQSVKAILDEARRAVRLEHPGIIQVYDVGEFDQRPFIVTQLVAGETLAHRLARTSCTLPEAAELTAQLADIVHHAHAQGWVHRDVKPSNILFDAQGKVYLTDFGLTARLEDLRRSAGVPAGTPPYMAPEIVRGVCGHPTDTTAADHRADIYALGVVLYEMLTGRRPYEHETRAELYEMILSKDPIPPRLINPHVPVRLEEACLKALAKDPGQRFRTAADFRDALREAIGNAAGADESTAASVLSAPRHARQYALAAIAMATVLALGVLAIRPWLSEPAPVPAPAVPAPVETNATANVVAELKAIRDELERMQGNVRAGLPSQRKPAPGKPVPPKAADVALPKAFADLEAKIAAAREQGNEEEESSLLLDATNKLIDAGLYALAKQLAERMVQLAGKIPSRAPIAYGQLGLAQYRLGMAEEAIANYEESLKTYQDLYQKLERLPRSDQVERALSHLARLAGLTLMRIGNANKYLERYQNAEAAYRQGKTLLEKHERNAELMTLLLNYGSLHSARGEQGTAVAMYEQGLKLARAAEKDTEAAQFLVNLGNAHSRGGDEAAALPCYAEAHKLLGPTASYEARAALLINWITSLLDVGQKDEALQKVEQLRRIARPNDDDAQRILRLMAPLAESPR